MTLLRFRRASDLKTTGVLTWYAVHGTSLLQNNTLTAGDNKGVAAWLLEREMARETDVAAEGFVAGFSQANVGDTTPNVLGAWCDDGSGEMCSLENSTCADGKSQSCRGRGPAFERLDQGTSSCFEIGKRQYAGARSIMVSGPVPVQQYLDMQRELHRSDKDRIHSTRRQLLSLDQLSNPSTSSTTWHSSSSPSPTEQKQSPVPQRSGTPLPLGQPMAPEPSTLRRATQESRTPTPSGRLSRAYCASRAPSRRSARSRSRCSWTWGR